MHVLLLAGVAATLGGLTPESVFLSEVVYNPVGAEPQGEWIELTNSADHAVSLEGLRIADAESDPDNEGILRFPAGATILALGVVVIANDAAAYRAVAGRAADFELRAGDPAVAEMSADIGLGGTNQLSLANTSDELLLLDVDGFIIDGVSWGRSVPMDGISNVDTGAEGFSLQRSISAVSGPGSFSFGVATPGIPRITDLNPAPADTGEGEGEGEGACTTSADCTSPQGCAEVPGLGLRCRAPDVSGLRIERSGFYALPAGRGQVPGTGILILHPRLGSLPAGVGCVLGTTVCIHAGELK